MAPKGVVAKTAAPGVGNPAAKSKMQLAADKAIETGKMANTLAKALGGGGGGGWKFVDFTSKDKKRESAGIVDLQYGLAEGVPAPGDMSEPDRGDV